MKHVSKTLLAAVTALCTATLGAPAVHAQANQPADSRDGTCTTAVGAFKDVTLRTPHVHDIDWLVCQGITTGYADGTFRGMTRFYRQDMAAFLRRYAKVKGYADAASWKPSAKDWKTFRDVGRGTPHAEDILWLAHTGISEGWLEKDGSRTFQGMSPIVRQDMAAFLKRLTVGIDPSKGVVANTVGFTDVTGRTPHAEEIRWLAGQGITSGYRNADGSLRYEGMTPTYRQDMAAFIHRVETNTMACTRTIPAKTHTQQVLVTPEHEETHIVTPEHTEKQLVTPEQTIQHPAVTHEEPVYEWQAVDVYRFPDGYVVSGRGPSEEEFMEHGDPGITTEWQQVQTGTKTVVDKEAWTETIPAVYKDVTIPAVTETVTIPAVYDTVTVVDEPARVGSCDTR